jgi:hypothetical protein
MQQMHPMEELTIAIIKLKEEILELQDAVHNLTSEMMNK